MAGSIRITNVNGISTVVDINTTGTPTELAAFSDAACTQAVSLPATITADTTFYVAQTGAVMLSVIVDSTEIAGPAEVFLSNAGPVTFSLDTDPRNSDIGVVLGLVANSGGSSETYLEVVQDVLLDGLQHFVTGFTDNNGAPTVGTSVAWNEGDGAVEFTDAGIYTVTYWARGDTGGDGGIPSDGALQLSSTNLFTDPVCPLVQVSLAGTLSIRGAASYRRHFDAGEALSPRVWIRGDDPAKNTGLRVGIWITT